MNIPEIFYIISAVFAFFSIITKCIELNKNIKEKKCIDISDILTNIFLAIMFFCKIPYLWDKIIARIAISIFGSSWLIIGLFQISALYDIN